jgi:hypothetical protein
VECLEIMSPLCPFEIVIFFMDAKILNEKYGIYSGIKIEQRKSTDSHYFELFSIFVFS